MSSSKVIWNSPEISKNRNILNARKLNYISIQSLKIQVFLFLIIITEMCLNLLLRISMRLYPSIYIYMLICKTFLTINLVFIVSYTYQIIQARFLIFLECRDNKTEPLLKSVIFEILPRLRIYYERLIKYEIISNWLRKDAIELETIKLKLDEERRKTLYKMYLPSLHASYNCCSGVTLSKDMYVPKESSIHGQYYEYASMSGIDHCKPAVTSTPYSIRRVPALYRFETPQQSQLQQWPVQDHPYMYGDHKWHSYDSTIIKYQPSTPSPTRISPYCPLSTLSFSYRDQSSILSEVPSSEVWQRLGIDSSNLDQWNLNIRQWLHGTIITRVVQEIDKLNDRCAQSGINDVVIGESNVQTLRQLATRPGNHFPTLSLLINFLDCSKDQAYVVNRIKELSQGCSLSKFQWDSGSSGTRHPWKEHLPNDSILILHLLSTYIDSRVHSNLHGVRTFSQQFIIDSIDNKDPSDWKDICVLLQDSVQPPHFKVIFDQMIYSTAAGRRNLFECLIMFFYKVYKNEGNLKWLNLGRSGLNLNWIFDESSGR